MLLRSWKLIRRSAGAVIGLALCTVSPAFADGIQRSQHGGRGTAQAGAFTARADAPSAVTYNPAAIIRLEGLQIEGGLDFSNPTDEYDSASGTHLANHTIQFPPAAYVTWRPEAAGRWAFGLGLDTPAWYRVDWRTALYPARFRTREQAARFFELHPVVAYELDESWSVGGGVRYLYGSLEHGFNVLGSFAGPNGQVPFELETLADANADALAFDLALHYDSTVWGLGAVYRSAAELDTTDGFDVDLREIGDPALSGQILAAFPYDRATQNFSLPAEIRAGVWLAPYPELKLELDLALRNWSSLDDSVFRITGDGAPPVTLTERRDWKNTIAVRLGAEGEITEEWSVGGGIAFEPSPVPGNTLEPGFPRGDAMVYALGASYNQDWISFDLGYSFHDYEERSATGLELLNPNRTARFSARDQVWSASARWRF